MTSQTAHTSEAMRMKKGENLRNKVARETDRHRDKNIDVVEVLKW